jgi:diguanylate cyclase (GGDEF)-like protein
MTAALVALVALAAGVAGGFLLARLLARPPRQAASAVPARRVSGPVSRERTQEALLAAFRPDEVPESADALREDQRILSDALREITKRRGATAAVLWALDEAAGGVAVPVASSADEARSSESPAFMPVIEPADRALIEWTAWERVLAFDRATDAPRLAVAPLDAAGLPGALSLHFDDRSNVAREAVREWLPQHALMMQTWYELVRTRADVARQNFRLRGLIRTAGTMQAARDPLELEGLLVADSLTVVGAEWAVLIRWDEGTRTGTVRAATATAVALGIEFGSLEVTAESIAGQVCVEGRPQVFTDARSFVRGEDLIFGGRSQLGPVGSLLAVPLRRGDRDRPIGVLVCGHRDQSALRALEARNARNLGIIAAGALETAWQVEDARQNARTDPLTGVANRRGFDERFAQVVQETDRYGGTAALILLDIDHFKNVNDAYGHEAGDAVLIAVASALVDGRRTVDLVARLGGEELAVLLPQTEAGGAREVAERLRRRIEDLRVRSGMHEVRVTASFGVGEYAARGGEAQKVFENADQALYAAKNSGRNRVQVAT